MNVSPHVSFSFLNENTQLSRPPVGVSAVVAVTTKGDFTPRLVKNLKQFKQWFGTEKVPDNTLSNVERALSMGSQLLISRVKPSGVITEGIAKPYNVTTSTVIEEQAKIKMQITDTLSIPNKEYEVIFEIHTAEAGLLPNNVAGIWLTLDRVVKGNTVTHSLIQSYTLSENQPSAIIDKMPLIVSTVSTVTSTQAFVDSTVFEQFLVNVPNIKMVFISSTNDQIDNLEDVVTYLKANPGFRVTFESTLAGEGPNINQTGITGIYQLPAGSAGSAPTKVEFIEAFERLLDNTEYYALAFSHIHQHLTADYEEVLKTASDRSKALQEFVLYVEVPKSNNTLATLEAKATAFLGSIGSHKNLAFFGGGIKLYHNGTLKDCDVLGTVLGLGDVSAKLQGPYASFAGMNRGLVADSVGPVIPNFGAPTRYEELNQIAAVKTAVFVVKDTPNAGRQTMLWHNFTTSPLNNSDKFLSSVRFGLYLKKNLRPILESKLEEPNYIPLWKAIYYEGKGLLDNLVGKAISSYEWLGDQHATGYDDMTINRESDVRLGKYKLVIRYKDIVSLQEVEVTLVVDASKNITLE